VQINAKTKHGLKKLNYDQRGKSWKRREKPLANSKKGNPKKYKRSGQPFTINRYIEGGHTY